MLTVNLIRLRKASQVVVLWNQLKNYKNNNNCALILGKCAFSIQTFLPCAQSITGLEKEIVEYCCAMLSISKQEDKFF